MKSLLIIIPLTLLSAFTAMSQETADSTTCCISPQVRLEILKKMNAQPTANRRSQNTVLYHWPLRQAEGSEYNDYYHISGYVDHDDSPGIADYKCGTRTYDGHGGLDIALWPFEWNMMQDNQVEVIAAADGVIIDKSDGRFDKYCTWVASSQANYVILQHEDGNHTLYWHLKKGSVTDKNIGEYVRQGTYLGVVGSSGLSSSPHLHFEVTDANMNPIDPFHSTCTGNSEGSLWATEKPYHEPAINHLQTNAKPIEYGFCPQLTKTNAVDVFEAGDEVYFYGFYRDMLQDVKQNYTITQPDGTIWKAWDKSETTYYSDYWYYTPYRLPANAMAGTWIFEANYMWQTVRHEFTVNSNSETTNNNDETTNTTTIDNTSDCGDELAGFSLLGERAGSKYFISNSIANWTVAAANAVSLDAALVTINDWEENEFIRKTLGDRMVFIGYNDATNEGQFRWTNGEPITFQKLEIDNTNDGDYAVMNYWDGAWALDAAINERLYVIELVCNNDANNGNGSNTGNDNGSETGYSDCSEDIADTRYLGDYEGHKYFISNNMKNWATAQATAEAAGGYIVSITSDGENQFIKNNIGEIVFIGYNDMDGNGVFAWDSGEQAAFTLVQDGGGRFAAINFWDGSWSLQGNNEFTERRFIIEVPCE